MSITDDDIRQLRAEALATGDNEQVAQCDLALSDVTSLSYPCPRCGGAGYVRSDEDDDTCPRCEGGEDVEYTELTLAERCDVTPAAAARIADARRACGQVIRAYAGWTCRIVRRACTNDAGARWTEHRVSIASPDREHYIVTHYRAADVEDSARFWPDKLPGLRVVRETGRPKHYHEP